MDSTRFTQFGTWQGSFELAGRTVPVDPARFLGTRDRSWGIRPLGEREAGAPGASPQFFWLWAPIHFDDHCTHFQVNEDETGRVWHQNGVIVPLLGAGGSSAGVPKRMVAVHHEVEWQKGPRRAERAHLTLIPQEGEARRLELEPVLTFQMRGLGYLDPEWGHGVWKGSHAVDGVTWELDELNPLEPWHVHVQQLCRVRSDGQEGLGAFEQLVIGPHAPSGFRELFDPAE